MILYKDFVSGRTIRKSFPYRVTILLRVRRGAIHPRDARGMVEEGGMEYIEVNPKISTRVSTFFVSPRTKLIEAWQCLFPGSRKDG